VTRPYLYTLLDRVCNLIMSGAYFKCGVLMPPPLASTTMQFYPTPPVPSGHMRQGSDSKAHNTRTSISVTAPASSGNAVSRARVALEYASLRYLVQSLCLTLSFVSN
jgi:hypothetical protein